MKPGTQMAIRNHALEMVPEEACGFILSVNGHEVVRPVKNIAEDPVNGFMIDPSEYLDVKNEGEILTVYHSHPEGQPAVASKADVAACDRLRIPYVIYYVENDRFEHIAPGTEPPLIGRQFIWHVFDCWTLIQDYYKLKLGISLQGFAYEPGFWFKGKNHYLEGAEQAGFFRVLDSNDMRLHDVVLMQINSTVPNHAALYIGENKILHHLLGRLSCRDVYGGYWRFVTTHIFRHKDVK